MADQLTDHFENICDKLVSGLRKNMDAKQDWRYELDKKQIVWAILMDLSKASDCLPHKLLLEKLKAHGLSDKANKLLESYLTMRKQRVKLGQTQSEWHEILKGVLRGSIIGPLLFNIFMNDMYYFINECQLYGYVYDNTLSKTAKNVESLTRSLESDAASTLSWFETTTRVPIRTSSKQILFWVWKIQKH